MAIILLVRMGGLGASIRKCQELGRLSSWRDQHDGFENPPSPLWISSKLRVKTLVF